MTTGLALLGAIRRRWADEVGFEEDGTSVEGREAAGAAVVAGDAARHRDVGRPREPGRRCRECHRGAGSARRPRAGQRRRRRQPPDLPPGEGARVGRGLPADARGGLAADPPGARRRRGPRRGAPPAVRRHHPRPGAPRAVVGGAPRDARPRGAPPAEPVPAGRAADPRACATSAARRVRRERPTRPGDDGDPVFAALREWRTGVGPRRGACPRT